MKEIALTLSQPVSLGLMMACLFILMAIFSVYVAHVESKSRQNNARLADELMGYIRGGGRLDLSEGSFDTLSHFESARTMGWTGWFAVWSVAALAGFGVVLWSHGSSTSEHASIAARTVEPVGPTISPLLTIPSGIRAGALVPPPSQAPVPYVEQPTTPPAVEATGALKQGRDGKAQEEDASAGSNEKERRRRARGVAQGSDVSEFDPSDNSPRARRLRKLAEQRAIREARVEQRKATRQARLEERRRRLEERRAAAAAKREEGEQGSRKSATRRTAEPDMGEMLRQERERAARKRSGSSSANDDPSETEAPSPAGDSEEANEHEEAPGKAVETQKPRRKRLQLDLSGDPLSF